MGTQYRSVIFYHDEEQAQIARGIMEEVADNLMHRLSPSLFLESSAPRKNTIVITLHATQHNPIAMVIAPKVAKFRRQYLDRLKKRS